MNVTTLLRRRVVRFTLAVAAALLLLLQLSWLSAFLAPTSLSSSLHSADYTRMVSELRADAAAFSPLHSTTWLLAFMHEAELVGEVELDNVKATLRVLRDAGVPDSRVVVMERRSRSGSSASEQSSKALSSALGVRVLSMRRGAADSSVVQYSEMLSALFASSDAAGPSAAKATFCALIPSHIRVAADLPAYFFHTARLLKVDSTLLAASASSPFSARALSSDWLPAAVAPAPSLSLLLRPAGVDSQLTSALPDVDSALLLTAASYAALSSALRSLPSSAATRSLPAALSTLAAGRSFVSPVVNRAVSLLPPATASARVSSRLSLLDAQSAVEWPPELAHTSIGYGHWLASLLPSCELLHSPDDVLDRRGECVVLVVPAASGADAEWHRWLSSWLGAYSAPPAQRRHEAAGEWRGVAALRISTSFVLLVAPYSPFMEFLPSLSTARTLSLTVRSLGCHLHRAAQPDLSHVMPFLSARSVTSQRCLNACVHRGFQYAGIEDGSVCRCGSGYSASLALDESSCPRRCSPHSSLPGDAPLSSTATCGGESAVSLYTDGGEAHVRYQRESATASFVRGKEGETCVAACARSGAGVCREELFSLLTCGSMRVLGYKSGECVEAAQVDDDSAVRGLHVASLPYVRTGGVVLGAARWYNCATVPLPETGRACVCAT